jgi:hypothetical protein
MTVSPPQFEDIWMYKYVRYEDNTFTFCDACSTRVTHKSMADATDKKPVSAGSIKLRYKEWRFGDGWSTSLNMGGKEDDQEWLEQVLKPLGYTYKEKYE